jgi:hypothetical protein
LNAHRKLVLLSEQYNSKLSADDTLGFGSSQTATASEEAQMVQNMRADRLETVQMARYAWRHRQERSLGAVEILSMGLAACGF